MLFYFVFLESKFIDWIFQKDLSCKTLKYDNSNKLQVIKVLVTCTSNIFGMAYMHQI